MNTILIVDDDADVRATITETLIGDGRLLLSAADGYEAYEAQRPPQDTPQVTKVPF